jgi:ketosteroid isomerase-like protein
MTDYTPTDYATGLIAHHGADEARAIAEAILEATRPFSPEEQRANFKRYQAAARIAHEANYAERGDRYAEPNEMEMHRGDPTADFELVRDEVVAAFGMTFERACRGFVSMFEANDVARSVERADPAIVAKIRAEVA